MANWFVRKTGSNANNGKTAETAWLTINKALEAASGVAGGDTIYVGAGVYREVVTVGITPASMVNLIGDNTGQFTGDAGTVRLTAYTTNDKTAPSATSPFNLNGKSFLTIEGFYIVPGSIATGVILSTTAVHDITVRRCVIQRFASAGISLVLPVETNSKVLIEKNVMIGGGTACVSLTLPTGSVADYNAGFTVRNNLMLGFSAGALAVASSGALAFKGGGGKFYNNTVFMPAVTFSGTSLAFSVGNQCQVYNNLVISGAFGPLTAGETGQIIEDYNFLASGASTKVTAGTHSVQGNPPPSAPLVEVGQAAIAGARLRPFLTPTIDSPILGFGTSEEVNLEEDLDGAPRPAGPGPTWATALKAAGARERGNTMQQETTTVRTGSNSGRITGPGYQDFQVPVDAVSTSVSVYARYDGTYAGTLPTIEILANATIGVTGTSSTMVAAANAWEQITVTTVPTAKGIITVRLRSLSTAGGGNAFFDDFSIA